MQATPAPKQRTMAYLLAGADTIQGIFPKMLKSLFKITETWKDILEFFTDFWVLLIAVSSIGSAYCDVSISANRCDTKNCVFQLWELACLVAGLVMSLILLGIYCTPVELLARHAFSEAAGTAAGFDFADIMRYYTTRLTSVKPGPGRGNFKPNQKEGLGLAHFSIEKAGTAVGWLTPDSFLVSVTSTGEKVCGHGPEVADSPGAESINNGQSPQLDATPIQIEDPKLEQYYLSLRDVKNPIPDHSGIEWEKIRCPKLIDTGVTLARCMEKTCIKPIIVKVDDIEYP
ncbi:hypothetical protein HDV05_001748, partial [Chytridiales sp. JEL 0842]